MVAIRWTSRVDCDVTVFNEPIFRVVFLNGINYFQPRLDLPRSKHANKEEKVNRSINLARPYFFWGFFFRFDTFVNVSYYIYYVTLAAYLRMHKLCASVYTM